VFRRIWLPQQAHADEAPPRPRIGSLVLTPWAVAAIVKARAAAAGFGGRNFGSHSLKRGARDVAKSRTLPRRRNRALAFAFVAAGRRTIPAAQCRHCQQLTQAALGSCVQRVV